MSTIGLVGIVPLLIGYYAAASPTTVQTAFTIPSLMNIPSVLIVGRLSSITGNKAPLIAGVCTVLISGLTPLFFELSFPMFIVVMAVMGLGTGTIMSTSVGLIAEHFEGVEQSNLMGMQSAFINIGAMIFAFVGGLLTGGDWRTAFAIYLLAVPILFICLILIPKDKPVKKIGGLKNKNRTKIIISKEVFIVAAMSFLVFLTTTGVYTANTALLIVERNLGEPAVANFASTIMTGSGIVVGVLYGFISKACKNFILPLGYLLFACGTLLLGSATSVLMIYIGSVIIGAGMSTALPAGLFRCARSVESGSATFALSIFVSSIGAASFFSPMIMNPVARAVADGSIHSRYIVGGIFAVAMAVLALIYVQISDHKKKKHIDI